MAQPAGRAATKHLLALIGASLLLVGLVLTFMPHSAHGVNCGSVYRTSIDPSIAAGEATCGILPDTGPHQAACDERPAPYHAPAYTLLAPGVPTFIIGIGWLDRLGRLLRRGVNR